MAGLCHLFVQLDLALPDRKAPDITHRPHHLQDYHTKHRHPPGQRSEKGELCLVVFLCSK